MKALVQILLGALVVFQAVAIVQEWPLFRAAWFGTPAEASATARLTDEQRQSAEAALRQYHALARHLYATAGDPRFTDRIPASQPVIDELLSDVAYLQHRGLTQQPNLVRLDVTTARALDERRVVLNTREYWVVQVVGATDRRPVEPPRSQRFDGKYLMQKQGNAWRVEQWDLAAPADVAPGGP